jgi:thiamine biosynthesis lipoprotein
LKRLLFFICILGLSSCQGSIVNVSKFQLGTLINLTFIDDEGRAPRTAEAVFDEIERIENLMSPYRRSSDVYRLNHEVAGPVRVSKETFDLVKKSIHVSVETGGCFDITFASIAGLWDYKSKDFVPPDRSTVARMLPLVGYRNIILYPKIRAIAFARPGVKIGLGGIAKGYAVQRGIETFRKRGVRSAIVEAGGDLQVIGTKFGKRWNIGLKDPRKNSIMLSLGLDDGEAVATSGDYERFATYRGVRYPHIIDPRTGYPTDKFASVSVISQSATLSDAYATSIFVMGLDRAREFLARHAEIAVILVDPKQNVYISSGLRDRITFLEHVKVTWL